MAKTVTILKEEYDSLKRKASLAEDLLFQLNASLKDIQAGRIKQALH